MNEENKVEEIKKDIFSDDVEIQKAITDSIDGGTERVAPKFFVDEETTVKIEVEILSHPLTGKILAVFPVGAIPSEKLEKSLVVSREWFEFSVPTFENVSIYRQKSSKYFQKETVVDANIFRSFILMIHLKDWSLKDEKGNPIILTKDVDDTLTKESVSFVNKVPTIVWDIVLTAYERETLIN